MIDSTCGVMGAAAAPWKARAAMSVAGVGASPPASEASVKPASPVRKARRRPTTSPSRAPVTTSVANAIVYMATTSCSWASEACRSARRLGVATIRIDASIEAIACPASTMSSVDMSPKAWLRPPAPSWTFVLALYDRSVLRSRVVLSHDGITVADVACRDEAGRGEVAEYSTSHHLVFVRQGCFVRRVDGAEALLDPTLAYCMNPGEEQRIDHPHDKGDDCTA